MRCRNRRAVSAFVCQMGARISSTSALVTSETGIFPMRGKAYRSKVKIHSRPCARLRQPACFCSTTRRGGFGEASVRPDLATLLGKRVAALAGQLTVGQRLFPGLGEGDQRDAAEPELAAPTPDEQALNPASGSARLDEEVQTVAVRVSSRRGSAHEGGRQGLVWMAALGLGFPRAGVALFVTVTIPT